MTLPLLNAFLRGACNNNAKYWRHCSASIDTRHHGFNCQSTRYFMCDTGCRHYAGAFAGCESFGTLTMCSLMFVRSPSKFRSSASLTSWACDIMGRTGISLTYKGRVDCM